MTMHTVQVTPSLEWVQQQEARPVRVKSAQELELDSLLQKLEEASTLFAEKTREEYGVEGSRAYAAMEEARKAWKLALRRANLPKPVRAPRKAPKQEPLLDAIFGAGKY